MGRTFGFVLGVICIILTASLVVTISNDSATIIGKDNTIQAITNQNNQLQMYLDGNRTLLQTITSLLNSVNSTYISYRAAHSYTDSQYDFLNSTYISYRATHSYTDSQYNSLNDIVNLAESYTLIPRQTVSQPASDYDYWVTPVRYAGYISVTVESSTTIDTYIQVIYIAYGVNFDETVAVGVSGTAVFPVLPASVQIRVGNTNSTGATGTVSATYYY